MNIYKGDRVRLVNDPETRLWPEFGLTGVITEDINEYDCYWVIFSTNMYSQPVHKSRLTLLNPQLQFAFMDE